jgi:cytochrome c oxidase subunit 3
VMLVGWFKNQIDESMAGMYSAQLGRSYRQGMAWFIFSEVMFFVAFFGALFYARTISIPWLGGASNNAMTNEVLWPTFEAVWPLLTTPGGESSTQMGWFGLPLANTVLLLVSSVTLHYAHTSLEQDKRSLIKVWLGLTILLGVIFLGLQGYEYVHAYDIGLTLDSGVYGNTFFLLTGFHGMHVTLGTIILIVLFFRILKGHFTPKEHFAFQAGSWYWHFVDVVWVVLFLFVYIL